MPDGRWHPKAIGGPGAAVGHVFTWAGIEPKWRTAASFLDTFFRDRFALTASTPTLALTYEPKANSAHVYLNGIYQDEGTDYNITGNYLGVLSAMGASSGDVLEVRYVKGGLGGALSTYSAEVLADLPALYWRLGDASGTAAADSSGNGRDGTFGGAPTLAQAGLLPGDPDDCVTFNGGTDHCEIGYASWLDTADLTLEALIQTTMGSTGSFIDRDGVSGREFQFRVSGTTHCIEFILLGTSFITCTASTPVNDGVPHLAHAVVRGGSGIELYLDGVLDGSQATAVALPQTPEPFRAGYNYSAPGPAQAFVGKIDEVAYYKTDLSAGRIAAHFAASGL